MDILYDQRNHENRRRALLRELQLQDKKNKAPLPYLIPSSLGVHMALRLPACPTRTCAICPCFQTSFGTVGLLNSFDGCLHGQVEEKQRQDAWKRSQLLQKIKGDTEKTRSLKEQREFLQQQRR